MFMDIGCAGPSEWRVVCSLLSSHIDMCTAALVLRQTVLIAPSTQFFFIVMAVLPHQFYIGTNLASKFSSSRWYKNNKSALLNIELLLSHWRFPDGIKSTHKNVASHTHTLLSIENNLFRNVWLEFDIAEVPLLIWANASGAAVKFYDAWDFSHRW